jgi:hypothetical protein
MEPEISDRDLGWECMGDSFLRWRPSVDLHHIFGVPAGALDMLLLSFPRRT